MPPSRPESQKARAVAFGARIRQLRRARYFTQRHVADLVPMSAGNLSRIETGDQGPPSDEIVKRLAATLEADPAELLELAGRGIRGDAFEQRVLGELRELRAGLERLEQRLRR